jgi:hypothetical protein
MTTGWNLCYDGRVASKADYRRRIARPLVGVLSRPSGFAFGGNRPVVAVERLCQAHGLDVSILACHRSTATPTRLEFVQGRRVCQDCNGSGRDGGLNLADDCRACYGAGRVE